MQAYTQTRAYDYYQYTLSFVFQVCEALEKT